MDIDTDKDIDIDIDTDTDTDTDIDTFIDTDTDKDIDYMGKTQTHVEEEHDAGLLAVVPGLVLEGVVEDVAPPRRLLHHLPTHPLTLSLPPPSPPPLPSLPPSPPSSLPPPSLSPPPHSRSAGGGAYAPERTCGRGGGQWRGICHAAYSTTRQRARWSRARRARSACQAAPL
jgi:hypothetical protein